MSAIAGPAVAGAIGPASFAVVVWGSILLVTAVFGYVVWAVLGDLTSD